MFLKNVFIQYLGYLETCQSSSASVIFFILAFFILAYLFSYSFV